MLVGRFVAARVLRSEEQTHVARSKLVRINREIPTMSCSFVDPSGRPEDLLLVSHIDQEFHPIIAESLAESRPARQVQDAH